MPGRTFRRERGTQMREVGFAVGLFALLSIALLTLLVLIVDVIVEGAGSLSASFFTETTSRVDPSSSGIAGPIMGTLYLMLVCAAFIIPVGVASAIYLEEYANREKRINRAIEVNIQNLAAVPSIVYGVLGLAFLVRGPISLGNVVVAGGLTLGLLVLPVVIVAGREAIRAVPPSIREGSMALGATKWQTIWKQVLPASIPGIATGTILALSRAIGEAAPTDRRRSDRVRNDIGYEPLQRHLLGAADSDLRLDRRRQRGVQAPRGRCNHRPYGNPAPR